MVTINSKSLPSLNIRQTLLRTATGTQYLDRTLGEEDRMSRVDRPFDCEFTLALNNRTGKYFFCKEMIQSSEDLIATCLYWRVPMKQL